MRPYILRGLAEYFGCSINELSDYVFEINALEYPATVYITAQGITFIYQQYEITAYVYGIPTAVVPATVEVVDMLTAAGQKFFR